MKHRASLFGVLVGSGLCHISAEAQTFPPTLVKRSEYTLNARAYIDSSQLPSRYDLRLYQKANIPYRWDFVIPGSSFARTRAIASVGSPDYRNHQRTTIRATLRQYDTYDEKVTFKNLDLAPVREEDRYPLVGPSRALSLPKTLSLKTPSGITITLPAQSYDGIPPFMAGNPSALFIRIEVRPNDKLIASLPDSPLFRKHRRPIKLQLGLLSMIYQKEEVRYYDDVTPNYGRVALSIPNLDSATHLDELTFYVRQRADLQTVPIAIEVPISRPAPGH